MKRSRYSESQIIQILKEGESGMPVTDICREHGINRSAYYKMEVQILGHGYPWGEASKGTGDRKPPTEADVRRIESRSQDIERHHLKKAVKPDARRKMATYAIEAHQSSERRACRLAALSWSGYRYMRKKSIDDEIKGKIVRREQGEIVFHHALRQLTENEYQKILSRATTNGSARNYILVIRCV